MTALRGGQSAYLAARVVTSGATFAVKGVRLAVATERDIERFAVEKTILCAGSGEEGIAQWAGETTCHWLMVATRWVEGEHLNGLHSPEIVYECLQTIHRIGELIRDEDIPNIEPHLRRRYRDSTDILDSLAPRDAAAARTALMDESQDIRLIHGGLWPDNILVSRGRPILLDWGSAGLADPAWDRANADLLGGQLSTKRPAHAESRGHLALRSIAAAMVLETDTTRRLEIAKSLMEATGD